MATNEIALQTRTQRDLERLVLEVANPHSLDFNQYLTPAELDRRFGRSTTAAPPGSAGGAETPALRPPTIGPSLPPQTGSPFQPADIAGIYEFDRLYAAGVVGSDDRRSTIAIATSGDLDRDALRHFWQALGVARDADAIEVIPVTGALTAPNTETTLDVEWASSLAPGARILVYAAADASAASFVQVYDRIVQDNRAAILSTSWGLCELDVPSAMRSEAHDIFQRAAAQGITVIAASGDNGAFDCGQSRPGVSFPASDPYVLAVGGTSLHDDGGGMNESAWVGSGGGPSQTWAPPPWQMTAAAGRAMADVAFNADPGTGFLAYIDGGWWNFGGTSVSAPCWAALMALINERRAASGRDTLGLAGPALCEIANSPEMTAVAFRDVVTGQSNAFPATPGWDFPTGWGTPRASNLADALATWDPPGDASGAASQSLILSPLNAAPGLVIARFAHRCLTTQLQLRARGLVPGRYSVTLDGDAIASFDVGTAVAVIDLDNIDPRGHTLDVRNDQQEIVYTGTVPDAPQPAVQLRVPLLSTGVLSDATGMVSYRAANGSEAFTVALQDVPDDDYVIRVGADEIGTVSVARGQHGGRVRFDSTGVMGRPVAVSPLCTVVAVLNSDGRMILRTRTDALDVASCPLQTD